MSKDMREDVERLNKYSGEILRLALAVERELEIFISNYFCEQPKAFFLHDNVILDLNFYRKISLFKRICLEEGIASSEIQKVVALANAVREIRNKVAHWQAMINDPSAGVVLQKRESILYKKDELKLTSEMVESVDAKRLAISICIALIVAELQKPGRVNKEKVF